MKELSDKELDLAIELIINPQFQHAWDKKGHDKKWVSECLPRYTQSWGLLMPLVIEYGITLYSPPHLLDGRWMAESHLEDFHIRSMDPKRACAECLLKVLKEMNK